MNQVFAAIEGGLQRTVMTKSIRVPDPTARISWGELFDKISILEIKSQRLHAQAALQNVRHELATLSRSLDQIDVPDRVSQPRTELSGVNERLWDIEDAIRDKEARKEFDAEFIELARSVYKTNDERSRLKREINELMHSELIEEKQYTCY